eukprot:gene1820-1106_t
MNLKTEDRAPFHSASSLSQISPAPPSHQSLSLSLRGFSSK